MEEIEPEWRKRNVIYPKDKNQNSRRRASSEILAIVPSMDERHEIIIHGIHQLVVMNLTRLHVNEKQRMMDFICGAAYALDLQVVSVAPDIYLVAPESIYISKNNDV